MWTREEGNRSGRKSKSKRVWGVNDDQWVRGRGVQDSYPEEYQWKKKGRKITMGHCMDWE